MIHGFPRRSLNRAGAWYNPAVCCKKAMSGSVDLQGKRNQEGLTSTGCAGRHWQGPEHTQGWWYRQWCSFCTKRRVVTGFGGVKEIRIIPVPGDVRS